MPGEGERERWLGDVEKAEGLFGGWGPRDAALISLKCLHTYVQSKTLDSIYVSALL